MFHHNVFSIIQIQLTGAPLAKSNYSFDKRMKELARKKKKEEKLQRKKGKDSSPSEEDTDQLQESNKGEVPGLGGTV